MADVELRFEGDSRDAQAAALALDAALEQIERLAESVSRALGEIKIGAGQVAAFVAEARAMEAALSGIERQAGQTRRSLEGMTAVEAIGGGFITRGPGGRFSGVLRNTYGPSLGYAPRIFGGGPWDETASIGYGTHGILSGGSGHDSYLGYLFSRATSRVGRDSVADILGGGGGGGGYGRGRYDVPGPNFLAGILPGGARARPAALGALALGGIAAGPDLLAPAVGLLASIPAYATTGAAAVGTLALAFAGVSKAIEGDGKAFKELNAQQQQFVLMARGLDPFLEKLKDVASRNLLPGVTRGLQSFLNPGTQAGITSTVGLYGRTLGGIASQWGSFAGSSDVQKMLSQLSQAGAGGLKDLSSVLMHIADAFGRIGVAALPLTKWFGDMAVKAATLFDKFIAGKAATGELGTFFKNLEGPISLVGNLVEQLGRLIFELASALHGAGTQALEGIVKLLTSLADWLERNRKTISDLATNAIKLLIQAFHDLGQVLGPIITGATTLVGAISGISAALGGVPAAVAAATVALVAFSKNPAVLGLTVIAAELSYLTSMVSGGGLTGDSHIKVGGKTYLIDPGATGKGGDVWALRQAGFKGPLNNAAQIQAAAVSLGGSTDVRGFTPPDTFKLPHATSVGSWAPGSVPTGGMGAAKSWQLPMQYQIEIARALTTAGTSDDVKAYTAAINYLVHLTRPGAPLSGADLVSALNDLASFQGDLKSIAKKATAGRASTASRTSGMTSARGVLGSISTALNLTGSNVGAVLPTDILSATPLADAHKQWDTQLQAWQAQIVAFEKQLRDKTISSEAVSTIKARITAIKQSVTSALADIKTAAQQQADNFKSVWDSYVSSFDAAFQKTTEDVLANPQKYPAILPLSAALADLEDQHNQDELQRRLSDAQKQLADALAGVGGDSSILDAARKKLGQDALAYALDRAQSIVLGGKPSDMAGQIIADMQQALSAVITPDPNAVASAQQAVADAEYEIKVDGLQKQAAAEQTAYRDARQALQDHLDKALQQWEDYYAKSGMSASEALAALNKLLVSFGFQPLPDPNATSTTTTTTTTPGSTVSPGAGGTDPSGIITPPTTTTTTTTTIGDAQSKVIPGVQRTGKMIFMAGGGLITSPHYLVDTSGVVRGMVGEKQPELVVPVTPTPGSFGGGQRAGGDGVQVQINYANGMEWLADFVSVQVTKSGVPATNKAIGRAADLRRRSGRH